MIKKLYFLGILLGCFIASLEGGYTLKGGKIVHTDDLAVMSVEGHFNAGVNAYESKQWYEAARQFHIVAYNFPCSEYGPQAAFYQGVSWYAVEEFDAANEAFSHYLKTRQDLTLFEEAIAYKFAIAEHFAHGAKRRFFGTRQLPKWASGKKVALEIYDEVIAAMPCHDLAAKALFAKGRMLCRDKDFRGSLEAFQQLIKRFPNHELSLEGYIAITNVYYLQSQYEFQNPDILALAQLNLRRFERAFPREERIELVRFKVAEIEELYAQGFYEIAQFYERVGHLCASKIYYNNAIIQFPNTQIADLCKKRLNELWPEQAASDAMTAHSKIADVHSS